ncbi:MAG TPA: aminopeptidase [Malonomonas sp.]
MWKLPVLGICLLSLCSCIRLDYYLHSITGHLQVLSKRQTISSLLQETTTPAALQDQLKQIVAIREFASQQLLLPRNGSYQKYADLDRPYVVWNVVATPEFSLEPLQWNFPFVGVVSYRGYFDLNKAKQFAGSLDDDDYDSIIIGVPAYSTLSWFDDPVLNTFSDWPAPAVAELIFHELAHQKLYIPDDTSFNESFATSVAQIGIDRWLQHKNDPALQLSHQDQTRRQQQFNNLLRTTRAELQKLYRRDIPRQQMREEKQQVFDNLKKNYQQLRESWQGYTGYDGWFSQLNNARFASTDSYQRWVPAFQLAMQQEDNDLERFYRRCRVIANLPAKTRHLLLDRLAADYRANTSPKEQAQ